MKALTVLRSTDAARRYSTRTMYGQCGDAEVQRGVRARNNNTFVVIRLLRIGRRERPSGVGVQLSKIADHAVHMGQGYVSANISRSFVGVAGTTGMPHNEMRPGMG